MKVIGYLVMESCEDYEQALKLVVGDSMPNGGILDWASGKPVAMFPSRIAARKAITRTEHYRLAYGVDDLPEKRYCKVVPIAEAA